MADYVITHIWHDADGEPYLRIVPGTAPHIDIAFYVADLFTEATGQPSAVYLLDTETAQMIQQQRPTEPTMDPDDIPRMRVLPSSGEGDPPDLVTAPNEGGGGGIGLRAGAGIGLPLSTTTGPADTTNEQNPDPAPEPAT